MQLRLHINVQDDSQTGQRQAFTGQPAPYEIALGTIALAAATAALGNPVKACVAGEKRRPTERPDDRSINVQRALVEITTVAFQEDANAEQDEKDGSFHCR